MTCPVCQPPEACKGYPHLWKRLREDPQRWRHVHDRVNSPPGNGVATQAAGHAAPLTDRATGQPDPTADPASAALQAYVARRGCCGSG
jgi:hypothetical protein